MNDVRKEIATRWAERTRPWVFAVAVGCLAWPLGAVAQTVDLPKELTKIPSATPAPAGEQPPAPAPVQPPAPAAPKPKPNAVTDAGDSPLETDPRRITALWNSHWRLYGSKFIPVGDDYAACPAFDIRYPSSTHMRVSDLMREKTEQQKVSSGGFVKTYTIKPDENDVEAYARALPKLALGEYGYIHSAKVDKVLGPDAMIISDVWLVDADEIKKAREKELEKYPEPARPRFDNRNRGNRSVSTSQRDRERQVQQQYDAQRQLRDAIVKHIEESYELRQKLMDEQGGNGFGQAIIVRGVNTGTVRPGSRWEGVRRGNGEQIAVVMLDQPEADKPQGASKAQDAGKSGGLSFLKNRTGRSGGKGGKMLVAVPAIEFRRSGLTEAQFLDLLAKRGMTVAEFVNLVLKVKRTAEFDPSNPFKPEPAVFAELESRRGQGEPGAVVKAPDAGATSANKPAGAPPPAKISELDFPLPKALTAPAVP